MKALVTGATGFIGSHIVDQLLARGDSVRALVRPGGHTHHVTQHKVQLALGDLFDPATLEEAVDGVAIVYHAAALGRWESSAEIFATNVTGTENLLAACIRCGVDRFVFLSSVSVYAPSPAPVVREDAPHGARDAYGQSKSAAEESVRRYAETGDIGYSILRPCRVYGEPYNQNTAQLLRKMRNPILFVGSGGCPYYNLVCVSDVAAAALLAGTCPDAAGQAFNITDGRGASQQEIAETIRAITGRIQLIVPIPRRLVTYAYQLHAMYSAYRTLDRRANPSAQWKQLFIGQRYDIHKARRLLGYEPKLDLREGLRRTLAWYEGRPG